MSTYTPISSITLSGATNSVTFSNVPQTYTDLVLVFAGTLSSTDSLVMRLNGDTNTNYSDTTMEGNGSSATSTRQSNYGYAFLNHGNLGTGQINSITNIMNYSNSTTNKTFLSRVNSAGAFVSAGVALWRSTAAVTSVTIICNANFASGSTFNLYGIVAGSGKAIGGNIIATDGTYWYHAFTSSGTFTPSTNLTNVDFLVVAGGGGGGATRGGGGGAGGLVYTPSNSLTSGTSYTVTIGAGGNAGTGTYGSITPPTQGSNSNITGGALSLTAAVGGGIGATLGVNETDGRYTGGNGGSGGGGGSNVGSAGIGGTGTAGQGNNGGNGQIGGEPYAGGGGGGAGAAGGVGVLSTRGGLGGNGLSTYSSWGSATSTGQNVTGTYWYAGGGGGGAYQTGTNAAGGNGGGGVGSGFAGVAGTAGTANTGGGGGGGNNGNNGGAGGSGIVIVRYAV